MSDRLPMMNSAANDAEILRNNMAALRKRDSELADRLEAVPAMEGIVVASSKTGPPTMRVALDGREIRFASAYDPVREAARMVDGVETKTFNVYFVLGFGMGYHVEGLLRSAHAKSHVFVLEACPGLFKRVLETRDLRELIRSDRVHFLLAPDSASLSQALTPFVSAILFGTRFVAHEPSVTCFGEAYRALRAMMTDFITFAHTSVSTTVSLSATSRLNSMMNAPYYCFSPGINDLKDALKGFPAVVVAAGPSLQRNIDQLHEVAGRGLIITMSTALKPLLARGIVPDFTCMIDFAWLSRKYFSGLEAYPPIAMVAEPKADPGTLDVHKGPKLVLADDYLDLVLEGVAPKKAVLRAGATVAHLSYYLAEFLGADPIVFVGQDLSFPDGITYTPGTASHDLWQLDSNRFQTLEMREWERIVRMRGDASRRDPGNERRVGQLLRVEGVRGNPIYTDQQMFTYLQQFERDFAKSRATIIDATEGGAAKRGTTAMTFREALQKYFTRPMPEELVEHIRHPGAGGMAVEEKPRVLDCLRSRIADAEDIRGFYEESLRVLREIQANLADRARAAEFQARVDALRREVEERKVVNALVMRIVQHREFLKYRMDREITGADLTDSERRARQLERDIAYIEGLMGGAGQLIEMLHAAVKRIEAYVPWGTGGAS